MEVELCDADGEVLQTVETSNIEISDDRGWRVDYLAEANPDIPDEVAEIRVLVPAAYRYDPRSEYVDRRTP